VDSRATTSFNLALGEAPIPPVPSVPAFDLRLIDPYRHKGEFAGMDTYRDLRPFVSPTQVDTFYIRFQPANLAFPVVFTWTEHLREDFGEARFVYKKGDALCTTDMILQHEVALSDSVSSMVVVITVGPKSVQSAH
jgi:hypothetical protein